MSKYYLLFAFLLAPTLLSAQSYTSWITGDPNDVQPLSIQRGMVLAGGGTDNDDAMTWMLNRAGGGDVLVIRASNSDGYNNYFFSELGVTVNSVETIRFNNADAATDPYVIERLEQAELLFIAGGDQYDYYQYWKDTPIETTINFLINQKRITVGGTSAGMAILGRAYYTPPGGSAESEDVLLNPFHSNLDILGNADFINNPLLENVITDTHYDQRERNGRHVVFLARLANTYGERFFGIACNEVTAVAIDESGTAHVFGEYPEYDDYAYFIQSNCESDFAAEQIEEGTPLTWNRNEQALSVYKAPGKIDGSTTFDLDNWQEGSGGSWEYWYVENGTLERVATTNAGCGNLTTSLTNDLLKNEIEVYPNPFLDKIWINIEYSEKVKTIELYNQIGKMLYQSKDISTQEVVNLEQLTAGIYWLKIETKTGVWSEKYLKF